MVEYATGAKANSEFDFKRQDSFTTEFWNHLSAYEWTLGAMWWEPTYAHNNWFGHSGSLYREAGGIRKRKRRAISHQSARCGCGDRLRRTRPGSVSP